jgi:hypothetical protein
VISRRELLISGACAAIAATGTTSLLKIFEEPKPEGPYFRLYTLAGLANVVCQTTDPLEQYFASQYLRARMEVLRHDNIVMTSAGLRKHTRAVGADTLAFSFAFPIFASRDSPPYDAAMKTTCFPHIIRDRMGFLGAVPVVQSAINSIGMSAEAMAWGPDNVLTSVCRPISSLMYDTYLPMLLAHEVGHLEVPDYPTLLSERHACMCEWPTLRELRKRTSSPLAQQFLNSQMKRTKDTISTATYLRSHGDDFLNAYPADITAGTIGMAKLSLEKLQKYASLEVRCENDRKLRQAANDLIERSAKKTFEHMAGTPPTEQAPIAQPQRIPNVEGGDRVVSF